MTASRARSLALLALLLAGLLPRALSMASPGRVAASISEDGYLMLTVARNVAAGRGLSTAAGTIPTNGVQPLVTFAWAGVHAVTPDDATALRVVVALEGLTAVAGALLVAALARHLFRRHADVDAISRIAAAAWFASPIALRHTTNGLETGLYAVTIAGILLLDARWRERMAPGPSVVLGMLLGVAVLVRNDAALLVAAWCLVRWLSPDRRATPGQRWLQATAAGLASLVIASPWLVFNYTRFGSIVPISGRSQSLDTPLGENLVKLPRVVLEYLLGGLPLPDALQVPGPWPWLTTGAALMLAGAAWQRRHALALEVDRTLVTLLLFLAGLATYYGAFFAAGHFLSRYLFPASLLAAPLLAAAGASLARRHAHAALVLACAWLGAAVLADARFAERAGRHPHMHVAEWVRANVAADEWVAAPQSGTVGYFHERTINLDGKVNPQALRARDEGRLFHYLVDDTEVRYVVDWFGLARWMDDPASVTDERDAGLLAREFRYRVKDPSRNLVVLARYPHTAARD